MFDSKDVRMRCRVVYDNQVARHRKKLEKSAGKGVKLEIAACDVLPYSFQQFFDWVWYKYGTKVHPCPYCSKPIDFRIMVFDHRMPLDSSGSITLDNLEGICKGCNELKGAQTPEQFTKLMVFLGSLSNSHRKYLEHRIRGGAVANRMRFFPQKKKTQPDGVPAEPKPRIKQSRLDLDGGMPPF